MEKVNSKIENSEELKLEESKRGKKHAHLRNKNAAEFKLINDGGEEVDLIPVDRPDEPEEITRIREKCFEMIVSTNDNKQEKEIPEGIQIIAKKISELSKETIQKYIEKNNVYLLFKNELNLNLEDLNSTELDFVLKLFSPNKDVKMKEYNEYGLPKDIDPEILQFVSNKEFNPATDEYIPPIFEAIHEDRIHFDLERNDLEEDYREVYDKLKDEIDVKEEDLVQKEINQINKKDKKEEEDGDFPDDFVLLANGGELPLALGEEMNNLDNYKEDNRIIDFDDLENLQEEEVNTNLNQPKKNTVQKEKEKQNAFENKQLYNEMYSNKQYKPSFKFITPEEVELLNTKYKETYKEYEDEKPKNEDKEKEKEKLDKKKEKEKLLDALNEMEEEYTTSKFPNKVKVEQVNEEEEYEDYEDYEDEDGEEGYDRFADFDAKELNDLKTQDGDELVSLVSKEQLEKFLNMQINHKINEDKGDEEEFDEVGFEGHEDFKGERINKKKDDKGKTKKDKRTITWEEIDAITINKEVNEKTLMMLESYAKKIEEEESKIAESKESNPKKRVAKYNKTGPATSTEEPEYYVIHNPRVYENIINSMKEDVKNENLPKKIGVKSEKLSKIEKNELKEQKSEAKKPEKKVFIINSRDYSKLIKKQINEEKTEKEVNKERKKLIKQENKERREKKKELKEAFKKEKGRVQKVIAESNKNMRNGLSVKEV